MDELTDKYLTLKGLAGYSSIPVATIRDYLRRDGLPHYRLRGKILVKLSEFEKWMEQFRVAGEDLQKHVSAIMRSLKNG